MIIQVNGIDFKTYRDNSWMILNMLCRCPFCEVRLVRNGFYVRLARLGQVFHLMIFRKYCSRCDIAFTLLPHFLLPRHLYLKIFISSWLWTCLTASLSCREFLRPLAPAHQKRSPGAKGESYTDHFDSCAVRPGRSLLQYWLKSFSQRATRSLPVIVACCVVVGRDLRRLPEIAGPFSGGIQQKAAPLALVLCLCSLLLSSHSLDLLFDRLLYFLLGP